MTALFFRSIEPASGWDAGRAAVTASQRGRMLCAVTRAVAEKGYANVTVADIVADAGVSRRTFYEQFANKEDCFLAAYEAGTASVIADIRSATQDTPVESLGDWRSILRMALETFTSELAREPDFAHAFLIDVLGAGPRAIERRLRVYEMFIDQFRALAVLAAHQDQTIGVVPDVTLRGLVGGIGEVVQHHILTDGAETLAELAPALAQLGVQVIEGAGALAAGRSS